MGDEFQVEDLRAQLSVATDEALALADEITDAIRAGRSSTPAVLCLAVDFQEKRLEVRHLRRAIAVEVAG